MVVHGVRRRVDAHGGRRLGLVRLDGIGDDRDLLQIPLRVELVVLHFVSGGAVGASQLVGVPVERALGVAGAELALFVFDESQHRPFRALGARARVDQVDAVRSFVRAVDVQPVALFVLRIDIHFHGAVAAHAAVYVESAHFRLGEPCVGVGHVDRARFVKMQIAERT